MLLVLALSTSHKYATVSEHFVPLPGHKNEQWPRVFAAVLAFALFWLYGHCEEALCYHRITRIRGVVWRPNFNILRQPWPTNRIGEREREPSPSRSVVQGQVRLLILLASRARCPAGAHDVCVMCTWVFHWDGDPLPDESGLRPSGIRLPNADSPPLVVFSVLWSVFYFVEGATIGESESHFWLSASAITQNMYNLIWQLVKQCEQRWLIDGQLVEGSINLLQLPAIF